MANPKNGIAYSRRMSPLRHEIERDQKLQGPPKPAPAPGKNLFKQRNKNGTVVRALAGASNPAGQRKKFK